MRKPFLSVIAVFLLISERFYTESPDKFFPSGEAKDRGIRGDASLFYVRRSVSCRCE